MKTFKALVEIEVQAEDADGVIDALFGDFSPVRIIDEDGTVVMSEEAPSEPVTAEATTPEPISWPDADAPYAVTYGFDAARVVGTVARKLHALADDLDVESRTLLRGDGKAGYHAGQIISHFTQQTGGLGTFLFSVVNSAAKADVHAAIAPIKKLAESWASHNEYDESDTEEGMGRAMGVSQTYEWVSSELLREIKEVTRP